MSATGTVTVTINGSFYSSSGFGNEYRTYSYYPPTPVGIYDGYASYPYTFYARDCSNYPQYTNCVEINTGDYLDCAPFGGSAGYYCTAMDYGYYYCDSLTCAWSSMCNLTSFNATNVYSLPATVDSAKNDYGGNPSQYHYPDNFVCGYPGECTSNVCVASPSCSDPSATFTITNNTDRTIKVYDDTTLLLTIGIGSTATTSTVYGESGKYQYCSAPLTNGEAPSIDIVGVWP